jgi:hypothetical protein
MTFKSNKKKIQFLQDNEIEYGEEQFMKLSRVKCEVSSYLKVPTLEGELIMTNYKIIFKWTPIYITLPDGNQ